MTLTLRIENFDALDDGGPTWITLDQRGASVGRRASMDWTLPDPGKHVSSHHFDVAYRDGAYWLTDVSTNGTYEADSHHRVAGPLQLLGGERLIVGHYVIYVHLANAAGELPRPVPDSTWSGGVDTTDPWNLAGKPLEPVNPLPPPTFSAHHLDDVAYDFVPLQRPNQQPAHPEQPPTPELPPMAQPHPGAVSHTSLHTLPPQSAAAAPTATQNAGADAVLEAFLRGAQLPPEAAQNVDPVQLAEAMGATLRVTAEQVMAMLRDRATLKQSLRTADRTMTTRTGNNPLKFMENPSDALDALFLNPRDGFSTGSDSFESALGDLHAHQIALVAALQPALSNLLSGLSPEEIATRAAEAGKILGGSRKSRNWDKFVATWDDKASTGDNGMLDAYLEAFIEVYTAAARRDR